MCGLATPLLAGMSGEPLVVSTQAQLWAESSWVPVAGVRGTLARVAAGGGPGSLGGLGVCQRSCMAMAVGGTSQAQIRLMDFYF